MGRSHSSLPQPWPSSYDTAINKQHPLVVRTDDVSSRLYLTVSSLGFISFLTWITGFWRTKGMSLFKQKWPECLCITVSTTSKPQTVSMKVRLCVLHVCVCLIIECLCLTPGFSTIILSSIEDAGPGGYYLRHLRCPTLCRCSRYGVLPHHTLWKASEVPSKETIIFSIELFASFVLFPDFILRPEQILAFHWWRHQDRCIREKGEDADADQLWAGLRSRHAALP